MQGVGLIGLTPVPHFKVDPALEIISNRVPELLRAETKRPIVICGPSGVGKNYVIQQLIARHPQLQRSVSHTTRKQRPGEEDGDAYHFVSEKLMYKLISEGAMIETDTIHGNMYGTSYAAVNLVHNSGNSCILDVTVSGAAALIEACSIWQNRLGLPLPFCIYLQPPSLAELERRLRYRDSENDAEIEQRLQQASTEMLDAVNMDMWDLIVTKRWTN